LIPIESLKADSDLVWVSPNFEPKHITDEAIIPVIITDVIPDPEAQDKKPVGKGEKLMQKLTVPQLGKWKLPKGDGSVITKVMFMPEGDRKKWFAKDKEGNYVGSEPHKQWTETELEERWGKYRPEKSKSPRHPFDQLGNSDGGAY
jgi:hypothetical protein